MKIRSADLDDAHAIAEIHVASWRSAYRGLMPDGLLDKLSVERREVEWRSAIDRGDPKVLVASVEPGQIVGWIAFGNCRDPDTPTTAGEMWAL